MGFDLPNWLRGRQIQTETVELDSYAIKKIAEEAPIEANVGSRLIGHFLELTQSAAQREELLEAELATANEFLAAQANEIESLRASLKLATQNNSSYEKLQQSQLLLSERDHVVAELHTALAVSNDKLKQLSEELDATGKRQALEARSLRAQIDEMTYRAVAAEKTLAVARRALGPMIGQYGAQADDQSEMISMLSRSLCDMSARAQLAEEMLFGLRKTMIGKLDLLEKVAAKRESMLQTVQLGLLDLLKTVSGRTRTLDRLRAVERIVDEFERCQVRMEQLPSQQLLPVSGI
jgi:hypothetical protein